MLMQPGPSSRFGALVAKSSAGVGGGLVALILSAIVVFVGIAMLVPNLNEGWLVAGFVGTAALTVFLYRLFDEGFQTHVYEKGFLKKTPWYTQTMAIEDVSRYYYHAVSVSVNFIPTGTSFTLTLHDRNGAKMTISSHSTTSGGRAITPEVVQTVAGIITSLKMQPMAEAFDRGEMLDFGPVQFGRQGLRFRGMLGGWKEIPLDQVHSYKIDSGVFYVNTQGAWLANSAQISSIPNFMVLAALMDAVFQPGSD